MTIEELTPLEWRSFSSTSYRLCFSDSRDSNVDRVDYALMAADEGKPIAYMTVKELDSETAYLQHGGNFHQGEKSVMAFKAYTQMLWRLRSKKYLNLYTFIDSENVRMLRVAMKAGFRISGVRLTKDHVLVEHRLNFQKET